MKKIISILAIVLFLFCFITFASFAHSGGTDSNGGHTDSSTGEYHYHHGYPAHQHPGGKCPYEKTNSSANNNEDTTLPAAKDNHNYMWGIIVVVAACVAVLTEKYWWGFLVCVANKIKGFIKKDSTAKTNEVVSAPEEIEEVEEVPDVYSEEKK